MLLSRISLRPSGSEVLLMTVNRDANGSEEVYRKPDREQNAGESFATD